MRFLRDIIILVALVGISTRVIQMILKKYMSRKQAMYGSYLFVLVVLGPITVYFLGLDVAIAELGISTMIWILFDLLWMQYKNYPDE